MKCFAMLVVAATFTFLCLDGYHNGLTDVWQRSSTFSSEPPDINWTHGWPCYFIVRPSIYPLSAGKGGPTPPSILGDGTGYYSRWPFDEAPIAAFRLDPLLIDLAFFVVLLAGTWLGVGELSRRMPVRFRFSLKTVIGITTLIAVVLAFRERLVLPRHVFQLAAMSVIALAAVLSLGGFSAGLLRLASRRRAPATPAPAAID